VLESEVRLPLVVVILTPLESVTVLPFCGNETLLAAQRRKIKAFNFRLLFTFSSSP